MPENRETASSLRESEYLADVIRELEAENAKLRARAGRRRGFSWRAFASALCIVVAAILVPVSVVSAWARAELTDESSFVATFAPLATDPTVQAAVTDAVVMLIDDEVDIDATTNALFDGVEELGLGDRAVAALDLLRAPAAAGIHTLLRTGVSTFVSSEAFADVWSAALRESHRALISAVTPATPTSALTIDGSGHVSIRLAPIIEAAKAHLLENGIELAAQIPVVDATFVIAQSDALVAVGTVYTLAVTAGVVVPLLCIGLFGAGILFARRRVHGVIGTGVGLAVSSSILLVGLTVGAAALVSLAVQMNISGDAAAAVYEQVIGRIRHTTTGVLIVGALIATLAILSNSGTVRGWIAALNEQVRQRIGLNGIADQRWRHVLREQHALITLTIIVLAVATVVIWPIGLTGILVTLATALIAWWALSVLEGQEGASAPARPRTFAPRDDVPEPAGLL
ncbi:hypothetical protein ASD65_02375 [Microbacterium sp. Root61]|uniref:hypothetical protein n=1 Tax=Microbacterium sp. Root61 TaxID=1736570 RepID=UPI0006FE5632|nr:hypothetical protein [Microbacterium sp. Root61]KRA23386.1 hypothetical protein ASD65_02375 [Microbacterium sp. Root61]